MRKEGLFLLIATFFVLMVGTSFVRNANKPTATGYEVGDVATDFDLKNIDGKRMSFGDFNSAKGFIVVFTCNHCPFSKLYEDRIIALDKEFKSKGYPVIAINPNDPVKQPEDSFEKMQVRAKERGFTFPYLFDETQEIARAYGAARTPHVYLLQKEKKGHVVKYIGAIDNNAQDASAATEFYVSDAVNSLLKGKKVEENFTKAIGCTIKWKDS